MGNGRDPDPTAPDARGSDTLWWMLDHPESRDLSRVGTRTEHVTHLFDPATYAASRGIDFGTFEAAYEDWRRVGRRLGLGFAENRNTVLKIILKVKDEPDLIGKWLQYHTDLVGDHNVIVVDCGSSDPRFLRILDGYRERVLVLPYGRYYDQIHQYAANRDLYDLLAGECRYLTVLDADEFLFGAHLGSIHPSFVVEILKSRIEPCVCGTWFSNTTPPEEDDRGIAWDQPLAFRVDSHRVKWGSRQGKSVVRSDLVSRTTYVGHNVGNRTMGRFVTPDSFGQLGIWHVNLLSHRINRGRAFQHLASKGVVSAGASPEQAEAALRAHLRSPDLKPVVAHYINRYLDPPAAAATRQGVLDTSLLAGGAPETHVALETWFHFDYERLLAEVRSEQLDAGGADSAASQPVVRVHSAHNLVVAYSPELGRCVQAEPTAARLGHALVPVQMRRNGTTALLFCSTVKAGRIGLGLDEHGNLSGAATRPETVFELSGTPAGRFALKAGAHFLCAEPTGRIVCNRTVASKWEQFHLG